MGWAASFVGLHDFGTHNMQGYSNLTAWFVPATFDGAAFGTTLITYRASINGRGAFRARILMWSFTAVSAWINWVHQPIGRAQFVAAGLPIAAVAVFDVVMLEMRGDYETRHGRRAFRLRPGLLILRWLVDRTGTSDAFRAQIRSISVTALAGLGSDLGGSRFETIPTNNRVPVNPDPAMFEPDPVDPDTGSPDTATADAAPPDPTAPDPTAPDQLAPDHIAPETLAPETLAADPASADVDTPVSDLDPIDPPGLAARVAEPVDQVTERAEPTARPGLADQPDSADRVDDTDQPAAPASSVNNRSDSYLYSDSYVPSWRTDSFDSELDARTRPAMEPVPEPTTSSTARATASATGSTTASADRATNDVVDRYDPAKYDPVRFDPSKYDTSKYEGARYDPARYDPVRYDPSKYDAGKDDTGKANGAADSSAPGSAETMEIPSMSANALRDAARDQLRGALASGEEPPTHQELAERYGRSRRWAREQLRAVREELDRQPKQQLVSVNGNGNGRR
jgi:hypothetical protein